MYHIKIINLYIVYNYIIHICSLNQECQQEYFKMKRKCNLCGEKVEKNSETVESRIHTSSSGEKYINLGEKKNVNCRPTQIGEPILLNPNSYNNLEQILDNLEVNLEIGSSREWSYIGCDGPPYCLASRLIDKIDRFQQWVVMLPGLGHLNMNQLKAFFKVKRCKFNGLLS